MRNLLRIQIGEGRKEIEGARARGGEWGGGGGTEAPAAKPLFMSSFSFADERKIAIGSFLIVRQSLPHTTF